MSDLYYCIEWNTLQALSIARQQDLENALLRLGQFREAFSELIGWIRDCSQKLSQRKEPGVDVEDLEQQLQDLKVREIKDLLVGLRVRGLVRVLAFQLG